MLSITVPILACLVAAIGLFAYFGRIDHKEIKTFENWKK